MFPRADFDEDVETTEEVACAQASMGAGSSVCLVDDSEVGGQGVVELRGPEAFVRYRTATVEPLLHVYLKSGDRFCCVEVTACDRERREYRFRWSNRQSFVKVEGRAASLPLFLGQSWQRLTFDVEDALRRAFGSTHCATTSVVLRGSSLRIFRLFFAGAIEPDIQLPKHLQILPTTTNTPISHLAPRTTTTTR